MNGVINWHVFLAHTITNLLWRGGDGVSWAYAPLQWRIQDFSRKMGTNLGGGRQPVVWQNFAENYPLGSVTAVDQCFWLVRVSLVIEFRNAKELKRLLICPKIGSQLLFVPQQ